MHKGRKNYTDTSPIHWHVVYQLINFWKTIDIHVAFDQFFAVLLFPHQVVKLTSARFYLNSIFFLPFSLPLFVDAFSFLLCLSTQFSLTFVIVYLYLYNLLHTACAVRNYICEFNANELMPHDTEIQRKSTFESQIYVHCTHCQSRANNKASDVWLQWKCVFFLLKPISVLHLLSIHTYRVFTCTYIQYLESFRLNLLLL